MTKVEYQELASELYDNLIKYKHYEFTYSKLKAQKNI